MLLEKKTCIGVDILLTLLVPLFRYHADRSLAIADWLLSAVPRHDSEPREQFSEHAHSPQTSVCGTAELPMSFKCKEMNLSILVDTMYH